MSRTLIVYATKEGQTARIAHRLSGVLSSEGHPAETREVTELGEHADLSSYDAIVVGGSVHRGKHAADLLRFVKANRDQLERACSAFFSVSMAQANPAQANQDEAQRYVDAFLEATGWTPDRTERFAGALAYTRYNWLMRQIMKRLARATGHSTDTSRDHVYTDWSRVDAFARDIEALAASPSPTASAPAASSSGSTTRA